MAKVRTPSHSVPHDDEIISYSSRSSSFDDEEDLDISQEFEDGDCSINLSDCDESTLVIDLSTPTMMRTHDIEGDILLPTGQNNVHSPLSRSVRSMGKAMAPRKRMSGIFKNGPNTDSAVFLHNGTPTTIAPADMHYKLASATSSPVGTFTPGVFRQFDLNFQNEGTLFQQFSPLKVDMNEFIDFSPEKRMETFKQPLPKSTKKLRAPRTSLGASQASPRSDEYALIASAFQSANATNSLKHHPRSPSRLPQPDLDLSSSSRKLRAAPAPSPERDAKRVRSRSRSPTKPMPSSATYPSIESIFPDIEIKPRVSEANNKLGGRRRRETLELRQFSNNLRDFANFSDKSLSTLAETSPYKAASPSLEGNISETPIPSKNNANSRRRSMSIPNFNTSHPPASERKPLVVTRDIETKKTDITLLNNQLKAVEAELALAKAQLITSQQAHETTLSELRAERIARERADDVIRYMTTESAFMVAAAQQLSQIATTSHEKTTTTRSKIATHHDNDDAKSTTSSRSYRSNHEPPARPASRFGSSRPVGNSTATNTTSSRIAHTSTNHGTTRTAREQHPRPHSTLSSYSRPASRQAGVLTNNHQKVLAASNVGNVLNQQTTNTHSLATKKSRANLSENIKPSGGAIRAVPKERRGIAEGGVARR